jgi:site-specific recombinase XerD
MATVIIQKYKGKSKTSYVVRYKDPFTQQFHHYKTLPKKKEAQQVANDLRALIDSGKLPRAKKSFQKKIVTFGEIIGVLEKEWEKKFQKKELSKVTYEGYMIRANVLRRKFEKTLVRELNKDAISDFQLELMDQSSVVSANRYLFILKQVFKKCVTEGALENDPTEEIRYLSEKEHERNNFILPEKIKKLVEASHQTRAKFYMPALIYLGAEHGTSKQEALCLKWSDIDFDFDETGIISFYRTKNHKERLDYLMPRAKEALIKWEAHLEWMRHRKKIAVKNSVYVFCRLDGIPLKGFGKAWRKTCEIAGIGNFHYHDLRHTFCSNLLLSGSNIKDVKEMIGHNDLSMTDRYSHLTLKHKKARQIELANHYGNKK